jgi:hypothetical protein
MQEQIHPERALEHKRVLHLKGGIGFSALVSPLSDDKWYCSVILEVPCKDGNTVTNLSQYNAAHFLIRSRRKV